MNVVLIVPPELESTIRAAGVDLSIPTDMPKCELVAGDVIAFPPPASLALRVVYRSFHPRDDLRQKPDRWLLHVEQVPHPLAV